MSDSINGERKPVLGCIADDVTGATDLATNLVQAGMRVLQVLGVPDEDVLATVASAGGHDAVVVALKTRSVPKQQAIDESIAALEALQSLGVKRFYFKYCSTFDSTEQGNIGPVAEALLDHLKADHAIFCPAFPKAGRTVYRGYLFVGDVLLSESGMKDHPLTPMTDANVVRVLAQQSTRDVGLFGYENYEQPSTSYLDVLSSLAKQGQPLIVTDVCSDAQLDQLAQGVADLPLLTGGSGLAHFLPAAYRKSGLLESEAYTAGIPQIAGRSLIVAGSCSPATNAQVDFMKSRCPTFAVDVPKVMNNAAEEQSKLAAWATTADATQPLLIYTTAQPEEVARLQQQFGRDKLAAVLEGFVAEASKSLVDDSNVRRLVLAGGETSGAIVNELGIRSISIGAQICTGVPWTESHGERPLALALKSGNFGEEDFFQTALEMLP